MDVRPHHFDGPAHPHPGGRRHLRGGALALTVLLALLGFLPIACGGGPSPEADQRSTSAKDHIPSLDDLGFELAQSEPEPFSSPQWDGHRALYRRTAGQEQAMIIVYVAQDEAFATRQFESMVAAFRNPPPSVFGAQAAVVDAPSPEVGDARHTYRTRDADSRGNMVWTDILRRGRLVVVVQFLGPASEDSLALRTSFAQRALGEAAR